MVYPTLFALAFLLFNFYYFIIVVQSLKCYAPKLEWVNDLPRFPRNEFELTECNTGIQKCVGGCKHCMIIEGSYIAKSCTVEDDVILMMLGVHEAGCKNVTEEQSEQYANWVNNSIGKQAQSALVPNSTRVCRCSWDGCNYSSSKVDRELFSHHNGATRFSGTILMKPLLLMTIVTTASVVVVLVGVCL